MGEGGRKEGIAKIGARTAKSLQTVWRHNATICASRPFNAKDREQIPTRQVSWLLAAVLLFSPSHSLYLEQWLRSLLSGGEEFPCQLQ